MDQRPPEKNLLLRNARIILPDGVIERGSVVMHEGRIARVGESQAIESGRETDATGLTLFPGFIDVHLHGAVGADILTATAADLERVSEFLVTQGVCGWLPTYVPASQENYISAMNAIEEAMRAESSGEARILGVHYEGPFVNSAQCGALHAEFFKTFSGPADLDALPVPQINDAVKMITIAPEIEGGVELVRELNRRGWIISIGHTRASVEVLDRACEAGAHHMTHFMNAMAPLHHRSPGPVAWGLARDSVTCDVIADGIHLDPYMLRLLVKLKSAGRLALISDSIAATGLGDGEYHIWNEKIEVKDGRTRNAQGSIAGSVITMFDAVRLMLSIGASEVEVARMAATNPARLLRIEKECGSIEVGKRADLVAMDQEGNVKLTIIGGRIAYDADSSVKH
jgi:N-acetylglucosamine-6-phosphate deacetylase